MERKTHARSVDGIHLHTGDTTPGVRLDPPDTSFDSFPIDLFDPIRVILALDLLSRLAQRVPSTSNLA